MSDAEETQGDEMPDLPRYVIWIVVLSRVLLSGVVTLGVVAIIAPFLGLPQIPTITSSVIVFGKWLFLFSVTAFVVIGVGFPVWVRLSWLMATPCSKILRDEVRKAFNDERDYKQQLEDMKSED